MRTTPMLFLAAAALLPLEAAEAAPSTSRITLSGFGVVSVVHAVDADGVETIGYLFGANVLHGQHPDLPGDQAIAFFGERCFPDPDLGCVTVSGAGPVSFQSQGLAGARLTGEVVLDTFCTFDECPPLEPATLAVDLAFAGTGQTHTSAFAYTANGPGSVYVNYRAGRWRYADVTGTATVDGAPATVDTAQLMAETSGEFNLVVVR